MRQRRRPAIDSRAPAGETFARVLTGYRVGVGHPGASSVPCVALELEDAAGRTVTYAVAVEDAIGLTRQVAIRLSRPPFEILASAGEQSSAALETLMGRVRESGSL